ncbi:MAG: cytochrome C oxidase subunit IV family protein [Chthoniobacteraceae bacterium]
MSDPNETKPTTGHDVAHGAHDDVSKHVKLYVLVGATLLFCTGLTVALSYVNFNRWFGQGRDWNIVVAMILATFKAGLVAAIFMHLLHEKWTIYRFLLLTVFFVIGLFALSLLGFTDHIRQ